VHIARARDVAQDESLVVEWYQKVAEQRNANAQYNLGFGVAQILSMVAKLYPQAAEQGVSKAQSNLVVANYIGSCVAEIRPLPW
jgi:TPR repeat protein